MELADTLYMITSDETAKKKVIQVSLKTLFRLKKEKPGKELKVKIASINELKRNEFREWFELKN